MGSRKLPKTELGIGLGWAGRVTWIVTVFVVSPCVAICPAAQEIVPKKAKTFAVIVRFQSIARVLRVI